MALIRLHIFVAYCTLKGRVTEVLEKTVWCDLGTNRTNKGVQSFFEEKNMGIIPICGGIHMRQDINQLIKTIMGIYKDV